MIIELSFPKNKQVMAKIGNFEILTDQPIKDGGNEEAPSPYSLFLVSLATCGGYYLLAFCQARGIDISKVKMIMEYIPRKDDVFKPTFVYRIRVSADFEDKYIEPLKRAINECAVKRAILAQPEFIIEVEK